MPHYHLMSLCLVIGLASSCSPDRVPRAVPTPSTPSSVPPRVESTAPPRYGPATSGSAPAASGGEYLLAIRDGNLFATLATDPSARQVNLAKAVQAAVSPRRGFLASIDPTGVNIYRLHSGAGIPRLTHVTTIAKGVGVALDDVRAVVAVPARAARDEQDCAIPTQLNEVLLGTGARRVVGNVEGTLVPLRLTRSGLISSAPTTDCASSRVMRTDMPSGKSRPVFGTGETLLLDADVATGDVWLRLPRDAEHPHGRQVVVDDRGSVKGDVPEFGVARFGPGGLIAYTLVHFGPAGTDSFYFPVRTEFRVGTSVPRATDRSADLRDATNPVFAPDGSVFLSAADPRDDTTFRAFSCAPRTVDRCVPLSLSWREEAVDLIAVV